MIYDQIKNNTVTWDGKRGQKISSVWFKLQEVCAKLSRDEILSWNYK